MRSLQGSSELRLAAVAAVLAALLALGCTADMKARGYAPEGRDDWQQPERVVADLALEPGMKVADLGAGGGYFSFRLAEAVGPTGRVFAVDIDPGMNERLARIAGERGVAQLVTVAAGEEDARIPEPVDLVFTSNTYHHLPDRVAYFRRLQGSLAPGGRLAVVEFRDEGFFHTVFGHATDAEAIRSELADAGYEQVADFDYLERQSFGIYRVSPAR